MFGTLIYSVLISLIPSMAWWIFILSQDVHQEKKQDLAEIFMIGVLTAAPVLLVVYWIFGLLEVFGVYLPPLAMGFISGAVVEEIVKLYMLYQFAMKRKFFDEPIDILVYSATVALGFAAIENVFFALSPFAEVGLERMILIRGITAVVVHIISTFFMGYYLYLYMETKRKRMLAYGLFAGIGFHGIYNVVVSTSLPGLFTAFYALGFIPAGMAIMIITEHLKKQSITT